MTDFAGLIQKARINWIISVDDSYHEGSPIDEAVKQGVLFDLVEHFDEHKTWICETLDSIDAPNIEEFDRDARKSVLEVHIDYLMQKEYVKKLLSSNGNHLKAMLSSIDGSEFVQEIKYLSNVKDAIAFLQGEFKAWSPDINHRVLWLVDRDFSDVGESPDAGLELIRAIGEANSQGNVCFLLTSKTDDISNEQIRSALYAANNVLAYYNLASVVDKAKLNTSGGLQDIIIAIWNNYNYLLITQMGEYLSKGLDEAKKAFMQIPASATKHIILNFAREEGVSVPDAITRVLTTLTDAEFGKLYCQDQDTISTLIDDYQSLAFSKQCRGNVSDCNPLFLKTLRKMEIYDFNINLLQAPIGFGDIFDFEKKRYILLTQPCDIAYRPKNNSRNLSQAILVKIEGKDKSAGGAQISHRSFPFWAHDEERELQLEFRDFMTVDFDTLDLCSLNRNGEAILSNEVLQSEKLAESVQRTVPYSPERVEAIIKYHKEKIANCDILLRVKELLNHARSANKEDEEIRKITTDYNRFLQKKRGDSFSKNATGVSYSINRRVKMKLPFALKLYMEFIAYHSRIGAPGDYLKILHQCDECTGAVQATK